MTQSSQQKAEFTDWCAHTLFTDDIVQAAALMQTALDLHLVSLYETLGLPKLLDEPRTAASVAASLGFVDSANITVEAMLDRLSAKTGAIERQAANGATSYVQTGEVATVPDSLDDIATRLAALGDDYLAPLEFLQFGEERFVTALRDDPELLDRILSGREKDNQELWFRATNVDPLQNVHGIMGAKAIDLLLDGGRILEIGGGTGNGIRNLFRHLDAKDELGRVEHYLFTDISQKFIMTTRHEIRSDYPGVDVGWRFADLNVPLDEQKIEPGSFDLIYAVNAAHVARDIVAFLESCRKTLRPGGRVLFAERIRLTPRDMAPRELALNLSIYHRTAAIRNDDYRPVHCYLAPENWLRVFELAGFSDADVWPDIDALAERFPDQYAAVVTAVA